MGLGIVVVSGEGARGVLVETVEVGRPAHHASSSGSASAVLSGRGQDDVAVDKLLRVAQMSTGVRMELTTDHTSFRMLDDLVRVARYAVSCTSSYSVSNSSRKPLFSLAGSDAMRAESARRVAWSFFAEPVDMIDLLGSGRL